ncbi:MAG: RNA methyltransferase [Patescibacteria group bacterium]|nr:MAG: RNA methyltransferase [Patescibacteria group bacterium]
MLYAYMKEKEAVVILHNIRSAHNVGAIFRTAEAAGVSRIYLTGYTPAPMDRFGRERRDIAKSALGAEKIVSWKQCKQAGSTVVKLKKEDFEIVAVEQARNSIDYKKFKPKRKTAFVFGNEVRGISPALLKQSDMIIEIPMKGEKESLNVSVAAGIILFRALDRT